MDLNLRHRNGQAGLIAVDVIPWGALRQGVRAVRLSDAYASRLRLSRLLVDVELRADVLLAAHVRATYNAGERPQRQVSVVRATGRREDWGVIGFKKRKKMVSESAGTVRLTVSRLKGGDAQALVFFSTEDGTALAGYDYEPQSGHMFFLRGQQTKEIKIL